MKENTHPEYQEVVYEDSQTKKRFIIGTTLQPKERTMFEGKEYPLYRLSVSCHSHPLFTGNNTLVDAEGRVDKFRKRYAPPAQKAAVPAAKAEETKKTRKTK